MSLALLSCQDDITDCHPERKDSTWTEGKTILFEYNTEYERNEYSIVEGENLLFEYNHRGAQCDNIFDDEWGEILAFNVEEGITEFEFVDEEILEINCFYREYGAWVSGIRHQVKNGVIRGKLLFGGNWAITVSVFTTPSNPNQESKAISFVDIFGD